MDEELEDDWDILVPPRPRTKADIACERLTEVLATQDQVFTLELRGYKEVGGDGQFFEETLPVDATMLIPKNTDISFRVPLFVLEECLLIDLKGKLKLNGETLICLDVEPISASPSTPSYINVEFQLG